MTDAVPRIDGVRRSPGLEGVSPVERLRRVVRRDERDEEPEPRPRPRARPQRGPEPDDDGRPHVDLLA